MGRETRLPESRTFYKTFVFSIKKHLNGLVFHKQ